MADEGDDKGKKEKKGSGMKSILIGLVIGLSIGGGAFFFLKGKEAPAQAQTAERPAEDGSEAPVEEVVADTPAEDDAGVIYDLEPFIVNLADTTKVRYLKTTIKLDLISEKYVEDMNAHLPKVRDTLLLLLSSKEFAAIRSVEGKMELRDEILQRVNAVFNNNKVKMAYFTDFVTQ